MEFIEKVPNSVINRKLVDVDVFPKCHLMARMQLLTAEDVHPLVMDATCLHAQQGMPEKTNA